MDNVSAGTLVSSLLISVVTLLGWLVTKAQARDKAFREELKWRRKQDRLRVRWQGRLVNRLEEEGISVPDKPEGLEDELDQTW